MHASDLVGKKIYELRAIAKQMLGVTDTKEVKSWLKRNLGEYRSKFTYLTTERLPNLRYKASWLTLCAVLIHISRQQQLKIAVKSWREMSIASLRCELGARNLHWQGVGNNGRNLTRSQMISLLEAVNYMPNVA